MVKLKWLKWLVVSLLITGSAYLISSYVYLAKASTIMLAFNSVNYESHLINSVLEARKDISIETKKGFIRELETSEQSRAFYDLKTRMVVTADPIEALKLGIFKQLKFIWNSGNYLRILSESEAYLDDFLTDRIQGK